tara:strand:- start:122 stop:361 length:240 start_codon:yes stop_codon:yes gene_type:complete
MGVTAIQHIAKSESFCDDATSSFIIHLFSLAHSGLPEMPEARYLLFRCGKRLTIKPQFAENSGLKRDLAVQCHEPPYHY